MTNLANGLVEAARAHDGRPALRLGDATVSFAEFDEASARVAAMLRGRGTAAGRPGRDHAAQRAGVSADLLRGVAGRRRGRADEPAAEVAGGGLLPGRLRRAADLRLHRVRRGGREGRRRGRRRVRRGHPGGVRADPGGRDAGHRVDRARAGGHRGDPLHVGHHRQAEGRRADPRQPGEERRGRPARPFRTHRRTT